MSPRRFSLPEARRIALAAQGFASQQHSTKANWLSMAKEIKRLHLLQIDSVNVISRSHYLPLFSRLGVYDRDLLDRHSFGTGKRHLFECWAHEASFVPVELHPLMRWRMERARKGDGIYVQMDRFGKEHTTFLNSTLEHIEKTGPIRASEVPGTGKGAGGWWGWSKGKLALETLFDQGRVTAAKRESFERIYDVPERVIPDHIHNLPTPPETESFRQLIVMAAQALGIATEVDLRDYFRLPVAEARIAIAECLARKDLVAVEVQGWTKPAYIHPQAKRPKVDAGTALLSPFDPVVWNRDRTERLFNYHYRLELYTPAPKRKFGYYVLPFLCDGALVARVCLKADRSTGTLMVNSAHGEEGCDKDHVSQQLGSALQRMGQWLSLPNFQVSKVGDLSANLRKQF